MRKLSRIWPPVAALWLAVCAGVVCAAELTTDAERTYRDLQKAKDPQSRLLAERWYNLIRRQEWDDATGRHKTIAKYVDHDPNLEWVKLRIIRGTGADRVVNDITIPLAKLSKTCQSRVRQIARLEQRVAAAAVEAVKASSAEDASGVAGGTADLRMEPAAHGEFAPSQGEDRGAELAGPAPPRAPTTMPLLPLPPLLPPLPSDAALARPQPSAEQPFEPGEQEAPTTVAPESAAPPSVEPSPLAPAQGGT